MARKQERQNKAAKRIAAGKTSVPALRLHKPDESIGAAVRQAFGVPAQPEDTSEQARTEAKFNAPPSVAAVVEVSKLVEQGWTEEAGGKVLDVWASGFKQAAEAMVLMVRDYQLGKLSFPVLNGMFMAHRAMDTSRDFVAEFKSYAKDSGRNVTDYTGPAIGTEAEWNKVKGDKTRFLSIRINDEGTALVQIIGQRSGGSESKLASAETLATDYNKIAASLRDYFGDVLSVYRKLPAKGTALCDEMVTLCTSEAAKIKADFEDSIRLAKQQQAA